MLSRRTRTCEHPAWRSSLTVAPSTGTSWTGPNGGPWGVRGLGPTTPGIRRDRTWPGQSRKACVSRTGRARRRRARGGQAEGRVRVKVVLSESGGVLGAGNSLSGGSGGGAARCALPGACGWRGARRAAQMQRLSTNHLAVCNTLVLRAWQLLHAFMRQLSIVGGFRWSGPLSTTTVKLWSRP